MNIAIESTSCIKCSRCVKACPCDIFFQKEAKSNIELQYLDYCIACGQCVAICPQDCIQHEVFPLDTVHSIDRDSLPSAEQVISLLRIRRSNRILSRKEVPLDKIEQIVEAAYRAPTSSNSQMVEFTVVTSADKLQKIEELTVGIFQGLLNKLNNFIVRPIIKMIQPDLLHYIPVVQRMKADLEAGHSPILRGGRALIFIHTPKADMFGCENANLAYQNASIMAESLGVSQIYMGYICIAIKQDRKKRIQKELGIDQQIHAVMSLGIPSSTFSRYIDKKPIRVTYL